MHIEHIAIYVNKLEDMKAFYMRFFNATSGEKYHNPQKQFTSYFLSFENGARLELMHRPDVVGYYGESSKEKFGLTHFAISVGSKSKVDSLTEEIRQANYMIASEPRTTGDGYYESVVIDPEGNRIEITI